MVQLREGLLDALPGLIVTHPEAAIYLVADFKNLVSVDFNISDFIHFCAFEGSVNVEGKSYTVLLASMDGFYLNNDTGETQARIAIVESPDQINMVPAVLTELFNMYCQRSD